MLKNHYYKFTTYRREKMSFLDKQFLDKNSCFLESLFGICKMVIAMFFLSIAVK